MSVQEVENFDSLVRIPDSQSLIVTSGYGTPSVPANRYSTDAAAVSANVRRSLVTVDPPYLEYLECCVLRSGYCILAVIGDPHRVNDTSMTTEREQLSLVLYVPKLQRHVRRS